MHKLTHAGLPRVALLLFGALVLFAYRCPVVIGAEPGSAVADPRPPNLSAGTRIIATSGDAYVAFDDRALEWQIGTKSIAQKLAYNPATGFRMTSLVNGITGHEWLAPGADSGVEAKLQVDGRSFDSSRSGTLLVGQSARTNADGALELAIDLKNGKLAVHLHYSIYPSTSVIEYWATVENSSDSASIDISTANSMSVALRPSDESLVLNWVQGVNPTVLDQNKPHRDPTLQVRSAQVNEGVTRTLGSNGRSSENCLAWVALAEPSMGEGMFAGVEWSGGWSMQVARRSGRTTVRAGLDRFRQILGPGQAFEFPRRFWGFYQGDLDAAGQASREFTRRYVLRKGQADFPWTQYNTWFAYYTDLKEERLKHEVDSAANLGLEVFTVDAGWYEGSPAEGDFSWGLGSWRENRDKFPGGLRALSDYVHARRMRFGLWVEPERVDLRYVGPDQEISRDWLSPGTAFDAAPPPGLPQTAQLCLGNQDARAWTLGWLTRVIQEYRVDWLKWDSNFWMSCDSPGKIGPENYAHVKGLYQVLDALRHRFPDLVIENCASGGNRMDYAIMRRTDVAWLSDETEPSYRVRYHAFGASYPFPPEYLNSWLVESYFEHLATAAKDQRLTRAWLGSRMLGAFGISVSTVEWTRQFRSTVAQEIKQYKGLRPLISTGNYYHLLPQTNLVEPQLLAPSDPDAAEFYDPVTNRGIVYLFKGRSAWTNRQVKLKGLTPDLAYDVASPDGLISLHGTGANLMSAPITVTGSANLHSVLLYVKPSSATAANISFPSP